MPTRSAKNGLADFACGDEVEFLLVDRKVRGVIVEDRGPIGIGGRRLYRVEVRFDPWNVMPFELPAVELSKVS